MVGLLIFILVIISIGFVFVVHTYLNCKDIEAHFARIIYRLDRILKEQKPKKPGPEVKNTYNISSLKSDYIKCLSDLKALAERNVIFQEIDAILRAHVTGDIDDETLYKLIDQRKKKWTEEKGEEPK